MILFALKWLINKFLIEKNWYFLFIILAFLTWEVVGFLDMFRDYYTSHEPWDFPSFGIMLVQNFQRGAIDSAMLLGLVLGKKYYENRIEHIELQNNQRELELKVLRAQYDPHFLYNSLNTIDALIDIAPKEKVKEYVSNLAALYRYLIDSKGREIVSLEEELELAKNYIYLIETRFGKDYNFCFSYNQIPEFQFLPHGSLLTALENVIKHNTPSNTAPIKTDIIINKSSIEIVNTVSSTKDVPNTTRVGLKNLKKRYELLSDHVVQITEASNKFRISLPLLKVINKA